MLVSLCLCHCLDLFCISGLCVYFALAVVADPAWDGSLITRMVAWLVDSGALHHMVPDQDLLHNFVPFVTKPHINTAKAGQGDFLVAMWSAA